MKDNYVVPSSYPGGRHLCMLANPPAKVQDGPSSAMSVNKKKEDHTSPPAVRLIHLERRTEFWQTFSLLH